MAHPPWQSQPTPAHTAGGLTVAEESATGIALARWKEGLLRSNLEAEYIEGWSSKVNRVLLDDHTYAEGHLLSRLTAVLLLFIEVFHEVKDFQPTVPDVISRGLIEDRYKFVAEYRAAVRLALLYIWHASSQKLQLLDQDRQARWQRAKEAGVDAELVLATANRDHVSFVHDNWLKYGYAFFLTEAFIIVKTEMTEVYGFEYSIHEIMRPLPSATIAKNEFLKTQPLANFGGDTIAYPPPPPGFENHSKFWSRHIDNPKGARDQLKLDQFFIGKATELLGHMTKSYFSSKDTAAKIHNLCYYNPSDTPPRRLSDFIKYRGRGVPKPTIPKDPTERRSLSESDDNEDGILRKDGHSEGAMIEELKVEMQMRKACRALIQMIRTYCCDLHPATKRHVIQAGMLADKEWTRLTKYGLSTSRDFERTRRALKNEWDIDLFQDSVEAMQAKIDKGSNPRSESFSEDVSLEALLARLPIALAEELHYLHACLLYCCNVQELNIQSSANQKSNRSKRNNLSDLSGEPL